MAACCDQNLALPLQMTTWSPSTQDAFRVVGLLCALLVGLMAVTLGYGIAAMPDPPTFDPVRIDVPEPEAIIERLRGFLRWACTLLTAAASAQYPRRSPHCISITHSFRRLPTVCDASAPDHVGPANASTFQVTLRTGLDPLSW